MVMVYISSSCECGGAVSCHLIRAVRCGVVSCHLGSSVWCGVSCHHASCGAVWCYLILSYLISSHPYGKVWYLMSSYQCVLSRSCRSTIIHRLTHTRCRESTRYYITLRDGSHNRRATTYDKDDSTHTIGDNDVHTHMLLKRVISMKTTTPVLLSPCHLWCGALMLSRLMLHSCAY